MSLFNSKTIQGKRYITPGEYINGIYVQGDTEDFQIRCSVQPLTPDEMVLLPEGRRDKQSYTIFTSSLLKVVNFETKLNADYLIINGENFEVFSVKPWQNNLINHYKAIVIKFDPRRIEE